MAASVLKNISGTPGGRKLSKTVSNATTTDLIRAREIIQKELFTTERLVSCMSVSKAKEGKKKKQPTFLCITVTSEKPVVCKLHTVKKAEKGDGYKKKASWELSDLKSVDGHYEGIAHQDAAAELDLVFDKVYKWRTDLPSERSDLIQVLWKLSRRYLKTQPKFENVGNVVSDVSLPSSSTVGQSAVDDGSFDPLSDLPYQANVLSIVSSEDHVLQLMQLIDEAINEVTLVESKLNTYDHAIAAVKEEMERMKDKDDLMKIREANLDKLVVDLNSFVKNLNLSEEHRAALIKPDLLSPGGIRMSTAAAIALQRCMDNSSIEPAMFHMKAYKTLTSEFSQLSKHFSVQLTNRLKTLFAEKTESSRFASLQGTLRSGELRIQGHQSLHKALLPYTGLLLWLKVMDSNSFYSLQKDYSISMRKVYEKEIGDFLELAKQRVGHKESRHHGPLSVRHSAGSSESLQSLDPRLLSADKQARQAFNKLVEKTFAELSPLCMAEQEFCIKFFHIDQNIVAGDETEKGSSVETQMLLSGIFSSLDKLLLNFINHCVKQDTFYSMSLLVHLSHHSKAAGSGGSGSFLGKVYFSVLVSVKRNFDDFIKQLCRSFEEAKASKKSRCGIIPFVHSFEEFAEQSESIFHNSDRRSDLDKAYKVIAQCLFNEVARIASEHLKTPRHVVMFENFHRIHAVLSRLKIVCLEVQKKDAKARYEEHMQAYVLEQLGRPMERLTLFFEGVEEELKSGVKAEEVGYVLAFNKQKLRKVIKEYPAKEIKNGLETLYRRLEKHMCEEQNLLQVVWNSMQKEFLNQYNLFVNMLAKCYAASNITLEFGINDVLQMFSDIAQMH
ncbi:exocyst complex component 1-like [Watersipora subatra]|uniref:exocyst complex component 1-like n=1 Tax=Watersipora subatra TaxID=2589382 RepID=UPI00355C6CD4